MTHLIGLCGYGTVGKDAVANILVERHGFTKMGFADALREAALTIDPIINGWVDCGEADARCGVTRYSEALRTHGYDRAKALYPEMRRFLQRLGTEVGRNIFGDDFWIDIAMRRRRPGPTVFSDVRFPNEAHAIWKRSGSIVRVTRPGFGPVNNHASEMALDHLTADFEIHNIGTLSDLAAAVGVLVA